MENIITWKYGDKLPIQPYFSKTNYKKKPIRYAIKIYFFFTERKYFLRVEKLLNEESDENNKIIFT